MPSAAWAAAARTASSVAGCPASASSTPRARSGVEPMLVRPDPGLGDGAAVDPDRGRDRHDRPLVGDPHELLVVRAPAGVLGDPDLGEDLVLADRGLEEVDEEVVGRHRPGAAAAGDHELRAQRQRRGAQVAGRVGVRERAAEGAPVPDLGVGEVLDRLGDQRGVLRRPAGPSRPRRAGSSRR